ncbi:hypothetical protein [Saccharothrix longispora]|uniref:hypothetical protein n=1 Tax=Saccharothrix longispora TaxID=33920 RepID=UPI0028FD8DCF|nr:hypothetical protein [Saccharothrix longispora]MBY8850593.1 hypothetical protein [Saccharothrix sp. MB29]MDU0293869.1 hypothetical protein [Saccharothrix longispora]
MNPLVRQVEQKTQDAQQNVKEFFDQVNHLLSWVPTPLEHMVAPIVLGMRLLSEKVAELWDHVGHLIEQWGDPDRLKQVGEQWVVQVGNVLGDVAGTLGLDKLRTTVEWEGRAARAYHAVVPAQPAGLTAVKDIANQLRTSLTSLANAIESFQMAMWFALGAFVVGAVGAIASACTVVGTPVGIAVLSGACGVAIALIGAAVLAMQSQLNTIEIEQMAIAQKVHDLGSDWAMPDTAAMADASATDGDGSDWRPGS